MAQAIVYTSNTCGYCKQLKSYLEEQNIPYEERNIDESETCREELGRLGIMSVPLTLIGDKQILGFNPARIQKALTSFQAAE